MSSLNGEVVIADQSVGDPLQLRIFGDEFYARRETMDGFTVIYDSERGCYCYATLAAGRFVSTGVPVHKPVPPYLRRHLKEDPEVRNEKFGRRYDRLRPFEDDADGRMRTLGPDGGLLSGRKLHKGQIRGLTVIVDFDDIRTNISTADVDAMFNADNYTANGNFCSVKGYFDLVSSKKLSYTNQVVGPIRLSKRRSHYIHNLLVKEAMDIVVNELHVDLRQFDSNNDNIVDAINFLYAGESQYDGDLWPHNSYQTLQYGNLRTHYYQLTGLGMHSVDLRIGTICHENGHLLCRFPDMYDYGKRDGDFEQSQGIGSYCLMGSGNHLNQRRTPAPICGYLRLLAGWIDTVTDLNSPGNYTIEHGCYNQVMKFSTNKANEYFVVENRSNFGLDSHLPSGGLAVLHCDTLGSNEWQEGTRNKHYQCALLQADGHLDLENNRNSGDHGDLFQAKSGIALSHETTPSTRSWDGTDSGLQIKNISPPGKFISFSTGNSPSQDVVHIETAPNMLIPDNDTTGLTSSLAVLANGEVASISIGVKIIHSWISDLKVSLQSPAGTIVVLHENEGADGDDIFRTWTSDNSVEMQRFHGETTQGDWQLHIVDKASADVGRLLQWQLDMTLDKAEGGLIEDQTEPMATIPDNDVTGITSTLKQTQKGQVKNIVVGVNIEHTYVGDLQLEVVSPSGYSVLLHDREGEWRDNLKRSYDLTSTPMLRGMIGQAIQGDWQLRVRDLAEADTGQLIGWSLQLDY